MDENKTPAQQAPDTAAPETTNIEQTTQPETAPAPEGTEAPKAPEAPETAAPAQKAEHGARWRHALWRGIAGVLAAVVLLAASGFGVFRIAKGAQSIEGTFDADPGTFVQHDIIFILDTFEDPAGGSAQYAVVPIGGQLVAFRFPARWDASVKTIADATTSVLQGQSYSIDSFIRVTGTVKAMPEAVSSEIYSWYTDNHDYLQKIGAIGDSDDAADYLPDAIVRVDYVGGIPQGWVEGLTVAAVACLIYAIVVFIRILCGKYDEQKLPDITFELVDMMPETPADPETTPEEIPEDYEYKFIDFVNPEILAVSEEEETAYEGCLSFPGHNGAVTRPAAVKVRAQDRNGNWFELEAENLLARCIQHENDHLDGITIMESSEYFYEDTEEGKKAAREAKGNN